MTAQFNDVVSHAGSDWTLAGANGEGLFDPKELGFNARAAGSACWRGFVCRYAVRAEKLWLEELNIALDGAPPALLGRQPQVPTSPLSVFTACYRKLGQPIDFTGGLLLAQDFLRQHYRHMGFHPAWKYAKVVEAELHAGHVIRVTDCSSAMAKLRERLAGTDLPSGGASRGEVLAWVEGTFSRRYRR